MKTGMKACLGLCACLGAAAAQDPLNLTGNVDVTQTDMRLNGSYVSVLNQKYALSINRTFTPYLSGDAALHFDHQGQEMDGVRSYNSQMAPMGQLTWNTPWFTVGALGERQISQSDNSDQDITRDNGSLSFHTKNQTWPRLNLGLDADHLYTPENPADRDIYESAVRGGLSWQYGTQNFAYNANGQQTENANLAAVEQRTSQTFRWNQNQAFLNQKLRVRSDYALSYLTSDYAKPAGVPILQWVPVQRVFYAVDPSPQYSVLDSVTGLLDGNKTAAVTPDIEVGQENLDGNIAMDFGSPKEIGTVYLYTNKKTLSPGVWTIYVSKADFYGNEMQWEALTDPVESRFDAAYQRFEISFPNTTSQFLKVVFKGTADTGRVAITELEAMRSEVGRSHDFQQTSTQILSMNSTYLISDRYDLSLDMGFQNEPFSSPEVKKKMICMSPCPAISAFRNSFPARRAFKMTKATSATTSYPPRLA